MIKPLKRRAIAASVFKLRKHKVRWVNRMNTKLYVEGQI